MTGQPPPWNDVGPFVAAFGFAIEAERWLWLENLLLEMRKTQPPLAFETGSELYC